MVMRCSGSLTSIPCISVLALSLIDFQHGKSNCNGSLSVILIAWTGC